MTENPRIIASAAPRDAPDATPKVNGDTNGFPKLPCIKVPAVASAAPAKIAIKTLGKRMFNRILRWISVGSSKPRTILIIFQKLSDLDEPKPIENNANIIVNKTNKVMYCPCRLDLFSI